MQYNTQLEQMILPEYGRNVQSMVEHALTIEDRQQRTQCARSIIKFMGNLFPHLRDADEFKHKLWDHLAIMSGFRLDIDYPCEVIQKDSLQKKPEILPYPADHIRFRQYGKLLEEMVEKARAMESGAEQRQLLLLIASRMKAIRQDIKYSGELEEEKIYKDLTIYFGGKLPFEVSDLVFVTKKSFHTPMRKNKNSSRRAVR